MKKQLQQFFLVVITMVITIPSLAQSKIKHKGFIGHEIPSLESELLGKADFNDWFYPAGAIGQLTTLDRSVGLLFPDSVVQIVGDDGEANFIFTHSVGAAFTPNDENLELIGQNIKLSRFNEYTVDSIRFPYLYVRNVDSIKNIELDDLLKALDSFSMSSNLSDSLLLDSLLTSNYFPSTEVVDTLIVQFFKADHMDARTQADEIYMRPKDWDQSTLGSVNPAYEMKIPLNHLDSSSKPSSSGWFTRLVTIGLPEDFNIDSDPSDPLEFKNAFGFSVAFKTMLDYSFGDTIESLSNDVISNKLNYYGVSQLTNSSIAVEQTKYINNSWRVPSKLLYGEDQRGWTIAIPGLAYESPFYLNYEVMVTTNSLNTETLDNNITFGVYPNPVSKGQTLKADFDLVNSTNVTISIYDLLGNKVKDVVNGFYVTGEHTVNVSTSDLAAGMYLYSVQAGNAVSTKKISIVE